MDIAAAVVVVVPAGMFEFVDVAGDSVDVVAVVDELTIWEKSHGSLQKTLRMKLILGTPRRNKKSRYSTWMNKQH